MEYLLFTEICLFVTKNIVVFIFEDLEKSLEGLSLMSR